MRKPSLRKPSLDRVRVGRMERGIAGLLAVLIAVLWFAGERASHGSQASGSMMGSAPAGGSAFIVLILAVIGINALFVAAETAIDLLTSLHVKHAPTEKQTLRLQSLLEDQQRYVAACSIGSQMARLALVFIGLLLARDLAMIMYGIDPQLGVNPEAIQAALVREFGSADLGQIALSGVGPERLASVVQSASEGAELTYGMILIAALVIAVPVLLVNLVLGELVPKSFATLHAGGVASRLYTFVRFTSLVFSLPVWLVVSVANLFAARFGGRASFTMANQAEEQIKNLVETAQESGEIESDERELLHSVFEFTDTVVREVMTPRVDLEAVPITSTPEELAHLVEETGHSRIPVYEETDDQIIGVVHAKDLLLAMVEGNAIDLQSMMRAPIFIPENMNLHEAMTQMRVHRSQMAIVQDEFGGTAGIVTMEDIVEELVGDIVDEYDDEEQDIVAAGDGYLVEGKTHLDDVNDAIGSNFHSEEFDTIGGFVFGLFGRQPKVDESIVSDGYRFTVAATDGRRIERIALELEQEAAAAEF